MLGHGSIMCKVKDSRHADMHCGLQLAGARLALLMDGSGGPSSANKLHRPYQRLWSPLVWFWLSLWVPQTWGGGAPQHTWWCDPAISSWCGCRCVSTMMWLPLWFLTLGCTLGCVSDSPREGGFTIMLHLAQPCRHHHAALCRPPVLVVSAVVHGPGT